MAIEAIAAVLPPAVTTAGYGADVGNVAGFSGALMQAGHTVPTQLAGPSAAPAMAAADVDAVSPALKGMFSALERVNGEAKAVGEFAQAAQLQGRDLSPGEIVQLTMRCHEFMFHCQLSSSIANRTSDGLQQLFRQQS